MASDGVGPGTPADWLRFARADLALARGSRDPDVLFELLCFHAQQAVEKALKAVLIHFGQTFPRTHNLRTLLDLADAACSVPVEVDDSALLTDYAVAQRYPGAYEPVDENDYHEAIRLATTVLRWADGMVNPPMNE